MKLQQLKYLCAIVDENFSITKAAAKLHTSQPGISKQLRMLEDELATRLLVRRRNRVIALTDGAQAILPTVRRMLKEAEALKQVLADAGDRTRGRLVIATTTVHARYTLVPIFQRFRKRYPRVTAEMLQGNPFEIARWVANGGADLGLGATPADLDPGLVSIPCVRMHHCVVAPPGHPLLRQRIPALADIARYPIVTTRAQSRLATLIAERFAHQGFAPNFVMHALDLETVKEYVRSGFGIAIIPTVAARDARRDDLRVLDINRVFEPVIASLIIQNDVPTRPYIADFIDMVAPRRNGARQITDIPGNARHA
jgi:LysR family cys regulon transcriptional activator